MAYLIILLQSDSQIVQTANNFQRTDIAKNTSLPQFFQQFTLMLLVVRN